MNRDWARYDGTEIIASGKFDVTWEDVRAYRNNLLHKTDLFYLKDRWDSLSNVAKGQINSYREALRDLPQTYPDSPNDAADNFPVPEEWFA